jgi:hypothetical protein
MSAGGAEILERPVFAGGATRPFGSLTCEDVADRARELRGVAGWGPTARVAPVARGWQSLADAMALAGVATVADLGSSELEQLTRGLWLTLPGG